MRTSLDSHIGGSDWHRYPSGGVAQVIADQTTQPVPANIGRSYHFATAGNPMLVHALLDDSVHAGTEIGAPVGNVAYRQAVLACLYQGEPSHLRVCQSGSRSWRTRIGPNYGATGWRQPRLGPGCHRPTEFSRDPGRIPVQTPRRRHRGVERSRLSRTIAVTPRGRANVVPGWSCHRCGGKAIGGRGPGQRGLGAGGSATGGRRGNRRRRPSPRPRATWNWLCGTTTTSESGTRYPRRSFGWNGA